MILHAKEKLPEAIDAALWPYAMRLTCEIDNSTVRKNCANSRVEDFSNIQICPKLRNFHTFGCPAYVLLNPDKSNKDKWEAGARLGIYIGISPKHARSVHLILNPATGLVSPQYHVKFDDLFQTIDKVRTKMEWKYKCHFKQPPDETTKQQTHHLIEDMNHLHNSDLPTSTSQESTYERNNTLNEAFHLDNEEEEMTNSVSQEMPENSTIISSPKQSKYRQQYKPTEKYKEYLDEIRHTAHTSTMSTVDDPAAYHEIDKMQEYDHPILYARKSTTDPDTLYLHEALQAPDSTQFKEAMVLEVNQHIARQNWVPVLKSDSPKHTIVLPAIWAMRRKRRIDTRKVYKWKS